MRLLLSISCVLLLPLISYSQEAVIPTVLRGVEAQESYSGTAVVREGRGTSIPSYLQFQAGRKLPVDKFTSWLYSVLKLDPKFSVMQIGTEKDKLGLSHFRYHAVPRL